MENHPLLIAAHNVVSAYILVQSNCNERGYRNAVIAAEQARDMFVKHLHMLETQVRQIRDRSIGSLENAPPRVKSIT